MQNKTFKAISAILQAQDVYEWDENICYECVNGLHVFLMQCCWYPKMYIIVENVNLLTGSLSMHEGNKSSPQRSPFISKIDNTGWVNKN